MSAGEIDLTSEPRELTLFLVAGEHSGDALGAKLMASLKAARRGPIRFLGVGGEQMAAEGLVSQFPISDVAVMGPLAILRRLPRITRRVYQTVDAAIAANPDCLVIIDSPEFTHPIARRVRRRRPTLPVVDYVSPSVWAWREGRASAMRRYVDHVMALWPFEPAVHARLGGPPCSYVGHPLAERLDWAESLDPAPLIERYRLARSRPILVVLPGSRPSEISRLMGPFGGAIEALLREDRLFQVIVPTLPHVRGLVEAEARLWPLVPLIIEGEEDRFRAIKAARAVLAASGTVNLEVAILGTPMVVAYRVDAIAARLRFLVKAPHFSPPNLVLGARVVPELMQEDCTPAKLAHALAELIDATPARDEQLARLAEIPGRLRLPEGTPSEAAARIVLAHAEPGAARCAQRAR